MSHANEIVLASGNLKKLAEMQAILAPLGRTLRAQSEFNVPESPEPFNTFVENALAKARNACAHTGRAAIADDSGICVEALGGAPGVHSAYYAGAQKVDAANNTKLITALQGVANRNAHYTCVIVYLRRTDDPEPIIVRGAWAGEIVDTPRGAGGFGYDPHFFVPTFGKTAAEIPSAQKNAVSHRAQALAQLVEQLRNARP